VPHSTTPLIENARTVPTRAKIIPELMELMDMSFPAPRRAVAD